MKTPGIQHLRQAAVIDPYPAVKDPCHYFYQEKNDQLGLTYSWTGKEFYFGNQPGKRDEINDKQEVLQAGMVLSRKIAIL